MKLNLLEAPLVVVSDYSQHFGQVVGTYECDLTLCECIFGIIRVLSSFPQNTKLAILSTLYTSNFKAFKDFRFRLMHFLRIVQMHSI